jgi:hypothetical protein
LLNFARRTADELAAAVDDKLRSVSTIAIQDVRVLFLPLGPIVRGEGVAPAEMVPVVDVFFDCDDFDIVDAAGVVKLLEKSVGGRATGAALGSE